MEVGGVLFFCCYFLPLHDSLVTESGCSGNDGAGELFWGIKTLSSRCFLVAIKFFPSFYRRMPMQICCPLRDEIEVRSLQDAIYQSGVA